MFSPEGTENYPIIAISSANGFMAVTAIEGITNTPVACISSPIFDYLLSGILVTPDGAAWWRNAGNYRAEKTNMRAESIETALLN